MKTLAMAAGALMMAGAAQADERNYAVGGFDRLELGGSPDVTVTTGRAVRVVATGSARALDRLDIRVENGTLKIEPKRGEGSSWNWRDEDQVRVSVSVPMLRGIEVGGSGDVRVDRVKTPDFAAAVGGSGNIDIAALDTRTAKFEVAGSGNIAAAGRCGTASASVAGSGNVKLAGLRCAVVDADIAGSGNIEASASQTAAVSIAGSGDARIGGGAKCRVSRAGSGTAVCTG